MTKQIVITGGGLAGMCAAIEANRIQDQHIKIIIIEKEKQLGGNSAKASSGVSALNVEEGDQNQTYVEDTIRSGDGNSNLELVQKLVDGSEDAIKFLEELGLDMSVIVKLGGHRHPRTHSCPNGAVGWNIVKSLIQTIEKQENIQVRTCTSLEKIERGNNGEVIGVQICADGKETLPCDAVVLTTGGFAASKEKLEMWCPSAAQLATTNGAWATGDGIVVGQKAGAGVVDLNQVQIHPTGFVDPADPDAQTKFLAPEKLRGCGAIMLNNNGQRFVDELQLRINVSQAVAEQQGDFVWMLLSEEGAQKFGMFAIEFYIKKGLIQKVPRNEIATTIGCKEEVIDDEFKRYSEAKQTGSDEFGKTTFPVDINQGDNYYLMKVTPVVHYCMGGLQINTDAQVIDAQGQPIPGFYAAGEVTGGVHGKNRLAGNSLLECIVYGRIAGRQSVMQASEGKINQENQNNN
eukprot:TRINITY_DN14646_c0_g1_i4.p1 TRINITY_DN14646_c0_g1~~TRINITY_DN14646_c0_g1_i4.p1  ORF type:complete len:470 (+),score=82.38 TRINITY_DN14646_c0_g1_i4:28-1410(+)